MVWLAASNQIEGKWKQFTGSGRERWGRLTDHVWETIAGKKDRLVGRIVGRALPSANRLLHTL
jgi:uncharacterized protein YjbJ (UPF0337 family)